MPDPAVKLRPWCSPSEGEQTELMLARQSVLDGEALTCSFVRELERMQAFPKERGMSERGMSITEAGIRSPRRRESRA
jgi:hypothetical protein